MERTKRDCEARCGCIIGRHRVCIAVYMCWIRCWCPTTGSPNASLPPCAGTAACMATFAAARRPVGVAGRMRAPRCCSPRRREVPPLHPPAPSFLPTPTSQPHITRRLPFRRAVPPTIAIPPLRDVCAGSTGYRLPSTFQDKMTYGPLCMRMVATSCIFVCLIGGLLVNLNVQGGMSR